MPGIELLVKRCSNIGQTQKKKRLLFQGHHLAIYHENLIVSFPNQ